MRGANCSCSKNERRRDRQSAKEPSIQVPGIPGSRRAFPGDVLPLSTMFAPRNVETSFEVAHELADFSGLSPFDIVVFRPQRLIIHGLLIRVTTTLSVPDGPDYEELGINLRSMVRRIFEGYVEPEMDALTGLYETIREQARAIIKEQLAQLRHSPKQPPPPPSGLFSTFGCIIFGTEIRAIAFIGPADCTVAEPFSSPG